MSLGAAPRRHATRDRNRLHRRHAESRHPDAHPRTRKGRPLTILATDADLGGIRIAEQLLSVAPEAQLLDVGTVPHDPQSKWPHANGYHAIERAVDGPAAPLAMAVLDRGYSLEQELLIIEAVDACLTEWSHLNDSA